MNRGLLVGLNIPNKPNCNFKRWVTAVLYNCLVCLLQSLGVSPTSLIPKFHMEFQTLKQTTNAGFSRRHFFVTKQSKFYLHHHVSEYLYLDLQRQANKTIPNSYLLFCGLLRSCRIKWKAFVQVECAIKLFFVCSCVWPCTCAIKILGR